MTAARGRFITLEGGEGVGKSTQLTALADRLRECGHMVVTTREPGGTPGGEAIRAMLLEGEGVRPRTEALLFAAARAEHVARLIEPALAAGTWVLCDRYIDSTRAYQAVAGEFGDRPTDEDIISVHRSGVGGLMPDLTLLLDLGEEVALERRARRGGTDAFERRTAAYHAEVNAAFRRLAQEDPDRIVRIDAAAEPEAVTSRLMSAITSRLGA